MGGLFFFIVLRSRLAPPAESTELVRSSASIESPPPTVEVSHSSTARPVDPDETKGAWAYSNECYLRWKAREFNEAERSCLRGLDHPEAFGKVRGALHYNLGLIAESRSDWAKAEDWLSESLRLRAKDDPGRVLVEKALERVRARR
jgi:hypothetical protein